MHRNKKQVTIYEIAENLGVAVSTVSRALHDDKRISPETIQKVKAAAAKMGIPAQFSRPQPENRTIQYHWPDCTRH